MYVKAKAITRNYRKRLVRKVVEIQKNKVINREKGYHRCNRWEFITPNRLEASAARNTWLNALGECIRVTTSHGESVQLSWRSWQYVQKFLMIVTKTMKSYGVLLTKCNFFIIYILPTPKVLDTLKTVIMAKSIINNNNCKLNLKSWSTYNI